MSKPSIILRESPADLLGSCAGGAIFSPCEQYRYRLWRCWSDDPHDQDCLFVMLNPSTADESADDPTVARCVAYAKRWGMRRVDVVNLFAYRATDPDAMRRATDPVGPRNDDYIIAAAAEADLIVCAWGAHGSLLERDRAVIKLLLEYGPGTVGALAITKDGHPGHPLYLRGDLKPIEYRGRA